MSHKIDSITLDSLTADPATPSEGEIWHRSDLNEMRCYLNGAVAIMEYDGHGHSPDDAGITAGVAASRPAAGTENRYYFATDTGILSRDNGTTWDDHAGGGGGAPAYTEATATADDTTTSSSAVLMNSMTVTPAAGTYRFEFSGSVQGSQKDQMVMVALYKDGVQQAHTIRHAHNMSGHLHVTMYPVHTAAKLTVSGSEAVEVKWWTDGTNTATVKQRCLSYMVVS